jgi:hypothetical protein
LQIQYSKASQGSRRETTIPFFGFGSDGRFVKGFHLTLQCSGVKHCQYAASEILNWNHVKVQPKDFQRIHADAISNSQQQSTDRWRQLQTEALVTISALLNNC